MSHPTTPKHWIPTCLFTITMLMCPAACNGFQAELAGGGSAAEVKSDELLTIDFSGGTVGEFIQDVKTTIDLNVVVDELAQDIRIPAIQLNDVEGEIAISILQHVSNQLEVFNENGILMIMGDHRFGTASKTMAVHEIGQILDVHDHESIMSAIQLGLEMQQSDPDSIEMHLHVETGLLFARGFRSELTLVQSVIEQLEKKARRNASGGGGFGTTPDPDLPPTDSDSRAR